MSGIDDIERKVKALLRQAADQVGTPEGDAFQAKAFDLMARYGVEQSQLADDSAAAGLTHQTVSISGSYSTEQATLLNSIAVALHCDCVGAKASRGRFDSVTVYGVRRHVERVIALYTILRAQMIAQANNAPAGIFSTSTRAVEKRSFMRGFTSIIAHRLAKAETGAAKDAGGRADLVVLDDAQRAERYRIEHTGALAKPKVRKVRNDRAAVAAGRAAGERADVGHSRVASRAAIGR